MSSRENIAKNIVDTLKTAVQPIRLAFVTRQTFDFDKLSNRQFPAVLVRTADENREDSTLGGTLGKRMSTITYDLVCFVKSKEIDTARNQIIETIEEILDVDRTRGGNAKDTQITSIEVDEGQITPIGGVILTVAVTYEYTRGIT
jgi:hypothetical protein|tara:strand:+ start:1980 stop:2414 length:435 start_codon:yes stop_codon:yes gene_type:complete